MKTTVMTTSPRTPLCCTWKPRTETCTASTLDEWCRAHLIEQCTAEKQTIKMCWVKTTHIQKTNNNKKEKKKKKKTTSTTTKPEENLEEEKALFAPITLHKTKTVEAFFALCQERKVSLHCLYDCFRVKSFKKDGPQHCKLWIVILPLSSHAHARVFVFCPHSHTPAQ